MNVVFDKSENSEKWLIVCYNFIDILYEGFIMAYLIRDGKLEKAQPITNLTVEQKKVLRVSTAKQSSKLKELKAQKEEKKAS